MVKMPTYYVIQLNPPEKHIVINYCFNDAPEKQLRELQTKFKYAVLRNDLIEGTDATLKDHNSCCRAISNSLTARGYISVSGGGLMNEYWQLYVIRANTMDSKLLYVGSTKYPREIRFKQHRIGLLSARIFNKNVPHSLDNDLFDSSVKYFDESSAKKAEKQLADELRKRHFDAKQA